MLHERYAEQGLALLFFPCNQFGKQEPKTNQEIKEFALAHGAKNPLFAKIKVNGKDAHPIYKYLKANLAGTLGSSIKWNFSKLVSNRQGKPVLRFGPYTSPLDMEDDIKRLLAEPATTSSADADTASAASASDNANDDVDDPAFASPRGEKRK